MLLIIKYLGYLVLVFTYYQEEVKIDHKLRVKKVKEAADSGYVRKQGGDLK